MSNTHAVPLPHNPSPDCHAKFNMAMTQFPVRYTWLHHQPTVPLSSVLHTPTQARTHSNTHLSLLSCDVARSSRAHSHPQPRNPPLKKENAVPCERLSLLRWGGSSALTALFSSAGCTCCVRDLAMAEFTLSDQMGKHHPLDTLKKKCFSSHGGVVLTWRLNVCEWAVHGFRSKLVLWISKRT